MTLKKVYAKESLMEKSLKKPLKFKKKIQMVKYHERRWSLFIEVQRKSSWKSFKLKELTIIGACKCQFLFENRPLWKTSRLEECSLLQKHLEETKIGNWLKKNRRLKKVNKVWLCQEFKINFGRRSGLANFKLLSVKPLKPKSRKNYQLQLNPLVKSPEKMKLIRRGSKKKLLEKDEDWKSLP